jgi:hypothetical protein
MQLAVFYNTTTCGLMSRQVKSPTHYIFAALALRYAFSRPQRYSADNLALSPTKSFFALTLAKLIATNGETQSHEEFRGGPEDVLTAKSLRLFF